jgi:hypothetical protein
MTPILNKFILSSHVYGLLRGILYNYDRKDKYNKQLIYTLTSTLIIFPFFIPFCLYSKNIELFLRNKKELMTSFFYDTHEYNHN